MAVVIFSERALKRLVQIHSFISLDSEKAAHKVIEKIIKRADAIKLFPLAGIEYPKNHNHRYIIYSHYKIFYSIQKDDIIILTVFDCRQNPKKLGKDL